MLRSPARGSLSIFLGLVACAPLVACGGEAESDSPPAADTPAENPSGPGAAETTGLTVAETALAFEAATTGEHPLLGDSLEVNGEKISLAEIKRHVLFVTNVGRGLFEEAKFQVHIDQEIQRQIEQEGKKPEDLGISQEELDAAVARIRQGVEDQIAGQANLDVADYVPENDPRWVGQVKQTELFKKVFLPENPHEYPPITVSALSESGEEGQNIFTVLVDDWDRTHGPDMEPAEEQNPRDPGVMLFNRMLTQKVLAHLDENSDIQMLEDGVPVELLGIVNGVKISVDSIWPKIENEITPLAVWKAKQWLVNTTLVKQALEESGHLLGRDDALAIWEEQAEPYKDSLFSLEKLSISIKKYPTLGMWLTYHRLYESFKLQRVEEMTDEVLDQQGIDRTAAIVSLAPADIDIILLSAYDFENKAWKKDGWQKAAERAREVAQKLADGENWGALLEEYSEFWDPPIPESQRGNQQVEMSLKRKGCFRGQHRNNLSRVLEEPEFLTFLNGGCITDMIFFEQEVGKIENPIVGPYGYYIPRLIHRAAPTVQLSAIDVKSRTYLEQDYLTERLALYAQELLAEATVTGL